MPASTLPPLNVAVPTLGGRRLPIVAAFAAVAIVLIVVGWFLLSNRGGRIPDVASLVGLDKTGVEQALQGAQEQPTAGDGVLKPLFTDAATEVAYVLPSLDTLGKRPEAKAAAIAKAELVATPQSAVRDHDAVVTLVFDGKGRVIAASLRMSARAMQDVLGADATLKDAAVAAGLPADSKDASTPESLSFYDEMGGTTYCATYGSSSTFLGTWMPLTDAELNPVEEAVDAGDLTLTFGGAEVLNPKNPFSGSGSSAVPEQPQTPELVTVPDFVKMYFKMWQDYTDGATPDTAIAERIEDAGFRAMIRIADDLYAGDTNQTPKAGTKVPRGTTVTLTIGAQGD